MTLDLYCKHCPHHHSWHASSGCQAWPTAASQCPCRGFEKRTPEEREPKYDPINYPYHYLTDRGFSAIDVIEAFDLPHHLACVIKYVLRHQNKGGLEDLKKAKWYLDRWIEREEERP